MSNPILASDLYKDDGAIKVGIDDLKNLRSQYQEMLKGIKIDAAALSIALSKANVAQEEQTGEVKKAATAADQLAKEQKKLNALLDENAIELAKLKNAQIEQRRINKATAKTLTNKATAYNKISAQYTLNAIKLNKLTRAEQENTAAGRLLVNQTRDLYNEMIRLQSLRGKDQLRVGKYKQAIGGLTGNLKALVGTYLSLQGVFQGARAVFSNTKDIDSLNLAYKQIIPNEERRGQALGFLDRISEAYGVNILKLRQSYLRFNAATKTSNLSTEARQKIFESLTKSTSILGLSAAKTDRAFNAFEQIMSKGKVSSEELRQQLGDSLPGSLTIMAKALGVSTGELDKMLKKGEVLAEDAMPKFAAELERTYGATNVTKIDNLAAAQGRYETALVNAVATLDGADAFKDFFNLMARGVTFLANNANAIYNIVKAVTVGAVAYGTFRASVLLSNISMTSSTLLAYREIAAREGVTLATALSTKATKALNLAIRANPIGLLVTVLVAAATAFALFKKEINATEEAMSDLGVTTEQRLVDERQELESYLNIANDELRSKKDRAIATAKLNSIIPNSIGLINAETVANGEAKKSVDLYIESQRERIRVQAAVELQSELIKQNLKDQAEGVTRQTTLWQKLKNFALSGGNAMSFAIRETADGTQNAVKAQKDYNEQLEFLQKIIDGRKDVVDPADPLSPIKPKGLGDEDVESKELDPFKAIELQLGAKEKGREKDLALLKLNFEKKKIEFEKYGLDVQILVDKLGRDTAAINRKYSDIELQRLADIEKIEIAEIERKAKAEKEANAAGEAARANRIQQENALFDKQQEFDQSEFDLLKKTAKEKEEFALKAEIAKLEKILEINEKFGGKLSESDISIAQNRIQGLQNEIDSLGKGGKAGDIYDVLGFKLSDENKANIGKSFDAIKGQFLELADFRLSIANDNVTAQNSEVSSAEAALQSQLQLQAQGHAANVQQAQLDLDVEKNKQAKAVEEQRKAQVAKQRIADAETLANLLVGLSLNIRNGGVLGIATNLITLAAFTATKIRAGNIAKTKFKDGGLEFIRGGSHASGNDTPLGFSKNGAPAYGERDEAHMIIKKAPAQKQKGILPRIFKSLNRGSFQEDFMFKDEMISNNYNFTDMTKTEKELSLIRSQGEQREYRDTSGNLIIQIGKHTTRYV